MGTQFPDYQQMIMQAYEHKKVKNTLPYGLKHLTPANVKEECIKRCTRAVSKRDEKIIRDFCADVDESRNCYAVIQRCDRDKFKPLVNYLKGKSEKTDVKNIELLAWLIDFNGRPWEYGKNISYEQCLDAELSVETDGEVEGKHQVHNTTPAIDKETEKPEIPENPPVPLTLTSSGGKDSGVLNLLETRKKGLFKRKSVKTFAITVMAALVLGTGGLWSWNIINQVPATGSCMYWKEDHYEPIGCDQKVSNARLIALDTVRLKNLRKITRPDTITYQAIGRVWYSKIAGKLEFYTAGGEHPVVYDRELKPVSAYIIDKYIRSGIIMK
ncbi:hypothetical protein SAMN05444266_102181 [Chitinophaga jiangningensis]|uniref:Uncharacterized protein n=1 Tax=Chitinophaga jiangningensis TaxID=1419482 RepID=A0A1M6Y777_9BACT|nr:hypothetical protein [Chitinophaga jiangningensis]SHL14051.1 hypothetical protein SAMN05444266_102181 [Chitinophaga jiangningensis]